MKAESSQVIGKKMGRNEKCVCGSGIKYKKCCKEIGIEVRKLPDNFKAELHPINKKDLLPIQERAGYFLSHLQKEFQNQASHLRVRAVNKRMLYRPVEETFHDFLIFLLKMTLSQEWIDTQRNTAIQDQHFIFCCFRNYFEWQEKTKNKEEMAATGRYSGFTDGYTQWLICLAFDIYCLQHSGHLNSSTLERLKSSNDQFQGARYEITIAAIFARAGFKIEFYNEKDPEVTQKKHCDFIAKDEQSDFRIAVEAKSRHRAGIMHDQNPLKAEKRYLKGDIHSLLRDAMEKETPQIPYMIFIDLNSPHTPNFIPEEKPWFKDIFVKIGNNTNERTSGKANLISITNFSYHYQEDTPSTQGEFLNSVARDPHYPIPENIYNRLLDVFRKYGGVPDLDKMFFK